VRVLCLTAGEFWEERFIGLDMPVIYVGNNRSRFQRLVRIVTELRRDPVDLIQSAHFYTNLYAAAAAQFLGVRAIGAVRSNVFNEVASNGKVIGHLGLKLPGLLAVNSDAAIQNAIRFGVPQSRLFKLPNVIDTHYFSSSPAITREAVHILAVGRLTPAKRFDRLLSVMAKLRERHGDKIHLTIVGSGRLREALVNQAASLKLTDVVTFHDVVEDVLPFYRNADIYALTSDFEGTPNVAMEAMACGLPIVSTAVGGAVELVEHGETGFLVPPGNDDEFVECMDRLIDSPVLRQQLGQQAAKHIQQFHSVERLPQYLASAYDRVLNS
jgi:glycosyltransferase involved in cell wall biosynthesis